MIVGDPTLRPTAKEAATILSQMAEDQPLHRTGMEKVLKAIRSSCSLGKAPTEIDWSRSLMECPIMAMEALPVPIVGPYYE